MQNVHIYLNIDKAINAAIRYNEAAYRFGAALPTPAKYYTWFALPDCFSYNKYYAS